NCSTVSYGNDFDGGIIIFDIQDQFWTLGFKPDQKLSEDSEQISDLNKWGLDPEEASNIKLWLPKGASFPSSNTTEFILSPSQLSASDWLSLLELERYSPQGQALLQLLEDYPNNKPN